MKRTRMRILAILLSLAMLVGLFPAAFAVEDEDSAPAESQAAASLQDEDAELNDVIDDIDGVYVVFMSDGYNMDAGDSMTISDALVTGVSGSMSYKWTSSKPSVASVSGNGEVATVSAKSEGTATITLTVTRASDGDTDSGSVDVWVHDNRVDPVTAKGSPAGSLTMNAGDSQSISISASGGSGRYGYAWEDNDGPAAVEPGASGNSCTIYGRYAGTGTITATVYDEADPSNYATISWSVKVNQSSTPLTLHISQNEMSLAAGEKGTLTLYAEGGSGSESNYEYYWQSDNPSVVSISGSGKTVTVTAASSIRGSSATAQITATVYDKVTKTTSETSACGIVVKNGSASYDASASARVGTNLPMQSIANSIASAFSTQFINESLSYSASVRISSPYSDVGAINFGNGGQVESGGNYSYAIMQDMIFVPTNAGTFKTNYSITDGGKTITGTITINVTGGGEVRTASLSPSSMRMATYSSQYLTLDVTPYNASYTVTWTSSNPKIATVNGTGNVVTVYSQGRTGTADITASIRSGGGTLSKSIPVTVYDEGRSTYNPTVTVTLGSDYYGTGISDSISKQWRNVFGVTLADNATITFGSTGNTRYGMLHLRNGSQIRANTNYTFLDFINTYFEPYAAGTFTLPYTVSYRGDTMSGTMEVVVRASSLSVSINPSSVTLATYSSRTLNLTISPSNAYNRVIWSTNNSSVATVSGSGTSVTLNTQGKIGTATITATVIDRNGNSIYRNCTVNVNNNSNSYDPTTTIPMGVAYTGTGNADALASQFKNVYNVTVNKNNAIIRFSSMGDSKIGVLHMPNGTAAKANTDYTLAQFSDQMYVEPVSAGTLRLPYSMTFNGKTLTGVASYVITSNKVNCSLTLKDENPYLFSTALANGAGGTQLSNTISNTVGSGWTYLRFGSWSGTVGTLYQNSNKAALNANLSIAPGDLSKLYFVPAQPGTFSAPFTVYNNSGKLADGTLSIVVPGMSFSDVPSNAYYANAVSWAVQNDVTTGTSATTFSPNDTVTRAQAVTFLWRANGRPAPTNTNNPFRDVAADEYYTQAVLWAVQQGITNGTSDTTFSPNATLAQDQMITFLCRASGVNAFGGNWSEAAMSWAQGRGLFNGRPSVPGAKENCPRADVVFYLWKDAN